MKPSFTLPFFRTQSVGAHAQQTEKLHLFKKPTSLLRPSLGRARSIDLCSSTLLALADAAVCLSLAPDGIFFNRPFFMRMQNEVEHQPKRTSLLQLREFDPIRLPPLFLFKSPPTAL